MINLSDPIEKLPYTGPKNLPRLKNLGIKTIKDLLWHFPSRYEDYSAIIPISEIKAGGSFNIKGEVVHVESTRSWKKRMSITTAIIKDETDTARAVWFNQPYVANQLKEGSLVSLAGKVSLDKKGIYLTSPAYEKLKSLNQLSAQSQLTHTGRLVPKYPETEGITSKYLRFLIKTALSRISKMADSLPREILDKYSFPNINQAIKNIHFPLSLEEAQKSKDRIAFDELLLFQLKALKSRRNLTQLTAPKIIFDKNLIKSFIEKLPFKLTADQKISAFEILKDLERSYPMNRLLNGDVGSGKTVVALIAAYEAIKAGYQVALMVPTEILAQQHFKTVNSMVKDPEIKTALLTASSKNKKNIIKEIETGHTDLVIGTHSLIQKGVKFNNLGLVIIDEQHRFGVQQRAALVRLKGKKQGASGNDSSYSPLAISDLPQVPHLLSMTATPIPRTLALTVYGDLDISLIKEKPKGRQTIITKVIPPLEKKLTYRFLDSEIEKGRQVFLVCPKIEANSKKPIANSNNHGYLPLAISPMQLIWQEVKAVTEEYERISKQVFPHRKVAMLHGKMPARKGRSLASGGKPTKEQVMQDFKDGKYDILVSTSVIEVGVDIPNATVMAIENAERFGLAQLHQFRGRVGRSEHQSYCILFCGTNQIMENKRLRALVNCDDGFELAEKDLQIRGPGQFFGSQQSGIPDLSMASLTNLELIKKARFEAKLLLKDDPGLSKYPLLQNQLVDFQKMRHFE